MGMDVGGSKKGAKADINMTPMIDIVLVLLIIFMVMMPSMMKHHTATVPSKAETNEPPPPPGSEQIVVEYSADRKVSINAEGVDIEALSGKLSDRLKNKAKKLVFFKIEDEANFGEAVKIMDIARGAGAEVLGIITPD